MSKILSIRVSEEIWEAFHQIANEHNLQVSEVLIEILENWLKENG